MPEVTELVDEKQESPQRRTTRADSDISAKLNSLESGSARHVVLTSAQDFKAAWVNLGEQLTLVKEQRLWKEWGFPTFHAYCARELHIRKDTANRLTRSFSFLRHHEPKVLAEPKEYLLPPLDVVELLAKARDKTNVPEPELQTIHEDVFRGEGATPTRRELMKRFRELDPNAFRAKPKASEPIIMIRRALLMAEKLKEFTEQSQDVSAETRLSLVDAVSEIRILLETKLKAERQENEKE